MVFFDGYGSHITFYTAHKAKEANFHIYSLSSTTYFQCLTATGCWGLWSSQKSLVSNFANVLQELKEQTVSKPAFPTLLKELYKETSVKKPNNTISGFKKSGLCLLDKERVPKSRIKPSSTLIPVNNSTPTQDENNVEFNITDTPRSNTAVDNSINSSNSIVNTPPVGPVTPRKAFCGAILAAIQPTQSNLIASALQNAKKQKETNVMGTWRSFNLGRIIGMT